MGGLAVLPATGFFAAARARGRELQFDHELYRQAHAVLHPEGDRLVELLRPAETLQNWTRLLGLRRQHVPMLQDNPAVMAAAVQQNVLRHNPQAKARAIHNADKTDALLDFLTWVPNDHVMEFNVFRYVVPVKGAGVVSFQAAHRFSSNEPGAAERLRHMRHKWIDLALSVDMRMVETMLD